MQIETVSLHAEPGSFADRVWPKDGSELRLDQCVMTISVDRREHIRRASANFTLPDQARLPLSLTELFGVTCRDRIVACIQRETNLRAGLKVSLADKSVPALRVSLLRCPFGAIDNPVWDIVIQTSLVLDAIPADHFQVLEKAADDAGDGLIVADENGLIERFSRCAEAIFDYQGREVTGKNISMLMPEPHRSRHAQYVKTHQSTGKGRILGIGPRELPISRKDGSATQIELSVSETWLDGRRKYIGICRDISERVKRQELLQQTKQSLAKHLQTLENANRVMQQRQEEISFLAESLEKARDEAVTANAAKSAFLATISHEIRTPLNGIVGMSQVLATSALDASQQEQLEVITQSASTLMALLNDLLDLSKIEAGQMRLETQQVDAFKFIDDIAEHWRRRARIKGLHLAFSHTGLTGFRINLDPLRISQVLNNLLSNAVKFTEKGEVSVTATLSRVDQQQGKLRIEVSDTGIGIPEAHQQKLFNPFVQADVSTTRRFGGTGLGLAICKRIVGLIGGDISMTSTSGSGSRFHFTIPVGIEPSGGIADRRLGHDLVIASDEALSLRILVAEDNKINQKVIGAILQTLGHMAVFANDGGEALELLDSSRFDLVLMDLHMPNMDGLTATRAIRARSDLAKQIPIIGLTASASQQDREDCAAAGMTDFVSKPIIIDAIRVALQNVRVTGRPTVEKEALAMAAKR